MADGIVLNPPLRRVLHSLYLALMGLAGHTFPKLRPNPSLSFEDLNSNPRALSRDGKRKTLGISLQSSVARAAVLGLQDLRCRVYKGSGLGHEEV